jgi:hypothetical protein
MYEDQYIRQFYRKDGVRMMIVLILTPLTSIELSYILILILTLLTFIELSYILILILFLPRLFYRKDGVRMMIGIQDSSIEVRGVRMMISI